MRTTVAVIGAGPAGLALANLLRHRGIDTLVLEAQTEAALLGTVRAGLIERSGMDVLHAAGIGGVACRHAVRQATVGLAVDGTLHRIGLGAGPDGGMWLYPQALVLRDLLEAHRAHGGAVRFGVRDVHLPEEDGPHVVTFTDDTGTHRLACDVVAGCDGAQGVSRAVLARRVPRASWREEVRRAPFAWLALLVEAPPAADTIAYVRHQRGFALLSTRTLDVQRWYLQCPLGSSPADWSEVRVRAELRRRCGGLDGVDLRPRRILDARIVSIRSRVVATLSHGRLALAGDAAHLTPPTGARGLTLALGDAADLAMTIAGALDRGRPADLSAYTARALPRIAAAIDFSWWMTGLLHVTPDGDPAQDAGLAALRELAGSPLAQARFADAYTGVVPLGLPSPGVHVLPAQVSDGLGRGPADAGPRTEHVAGSGFSAILASDKL